MVEPETPRDSRPRERRPRGILTILLVVAMGATILFVFGEGGGGAEKLDWLDFDRRLENGDVGRLTVIRDEWVLTGTWKETGPDGREQSFRVALPHPEILDREYIETRIRPNVTRFTTEFPSRFWAYLLPIIPWILLIGLFWFLYMRQSRSAGGPPGMLSFGKSRARMHRSEHTTVTFEDVAGIEEAKEEVGEIIAFLKNPMRFQRLGGRVPKGVLLVGAPGTGKTLLAKAISGEADVPFFSISGSDFVEMFVGVGASRVRDLFKQARENSPCIIFLDEIDAVGRKRGAGLGGGHDEREQTLNAILVEMDGFETDEGIIILASTNRPDILDPALLRPGRFDRQVVVDMPDLKGRLAILEVHARNVKLDPDVDLTVIARGTPSFSGADLAAVVNEAALLATMKDKDSVELDDLEEARDKVRWGRQKRSRVLELEDRRITACHESGHALVAQYEDDAEPLHKVTIIPRGMALGATMQLPERDRYHMQKSRLLAMITVLFGGRVAEEMFCDDITSGAQNDIERATEIARRMVTEWGMSERIGPIHYREGQEHVFLGHDVMKQRHHSEKTAVEIDEEVRRIVEECHERARTILDGHRAEMESLTDALLRYEVLTGREVEAVLDGMSVEAHRRSATKKKRKAGSPADSSAGKDPGPADEPRTEDEPSAEGGFAY
ncbi:MAG: ATP-dependent zinc metalloprotease FtsH [Planctomycetota bacterium]